MERHEKEDVEENVISVGKMENMGIRAKIVAKVEAGGVRM